MRLKDSASTACRLCNGEAVHRFNKTLLQKYDVGYFECRACGSLQTEEPFWLNESYADQRRVLDVRAADRILELRMISYVVFRLLGLKWSAKILDWGSGDGLLVRMLRDIGLDAYHWDKYATNTYAPGFERDDAAQYSMITAFEVWEHLPQPEAEIGAIFALQPEAHLATTSLYTGQGGDWDYLNILTGRHVFFYSRNALEQIARQYGYHVDVFGNKLILFHRRPLSKLNSRMFARFMNLHRSAWIRAGFELWGKSSRTAADARLVREAVARGELWKGPA